jgi:hypothetical protein
MLHLLTAAIGTKPTSQHVRDQGQSRRIIGLPATSVMPPYVPTD